MAVFYCRSKYGQSGQSLLCGIIKLSESRLLRQMIQISRLDRTQDGCTAVCRKINVMVNTSKHNCDCKKKKEKKKCFFHWDRQFGQKVVENLIFFFFFF